MRTVGIDTEAQDDKTWCVGWGNKNIRSATTDITQGLTHAMMVGDVPVFQNGGFDIPMLEEATDFRFKQWEDTILGAHMLGYRPLNLAAMSAAFNGVPLDKTFVKERKKIRYEERPDMVLEGCSLDAWAAYSLWQKIQIELDAHPRWRELYEKEKQFSRVLMDVKKRGLPLSQEKLKQAKTTILRRMGSLEIDLMAVGIDEPGDREFVGQKFWRNKKRLLYTNNGKLSTKGEDLLEHALPEDRGWVESFIEWHKMAKFLSTYIGNWIGQDFLHPSLNQTGTITWRLSCSDPNLQNVTKSKVVPLFQLFVAPEGFTFISADYSQVELRRLAVSAQDQTMLDVYRAGGDLHQETVDGLIASGALPHAPRDHAEEDAFRRFAKTLNFGIPYGMGGKTYAKRTGLKTIIKHDKWGNPMSRDRWYEGPDEAAGNRHIAGWYARFDAVRPWQEKQIAFAEEHGYVETLEGRPLWVPSIYANRGYLYSHAQKQCGNFPIQGGGHEVTKDAMIRNPEYLVMQVHDEVLYLVPNAQADDYYEHLNEDLVDYRHEIPYTIDIKRGNTWGDIKNIEDIWLKSDGEDEDDED